MTLSFSSILRNSTANSEISFYVSFGVWTIAPEENCPQLGVWVGLGLGLEGNFPQGQ